MNPQVVARPVSTFVRPIPERQVNTEGVQLAEAIGAFHKPLSAFLEQRKSANQAREIAEGQRLYQENNMRQSWEDFLASNPDVKKSRDIKYGYLAASAGAERIMFNDYMNQKFASGDGSWVKPDGSTVNIFTTDDPTVFPMWMNQQASQWLQEQYGEDGFDNQLYNDVFLPGIQQTTNELGAKYLARRVAEIESQNVAQNVRYIKAITANMISEGTFMGTDAEGRYELATQIGSVAYAMQAQGMDVAKQKQVIYNAIVGLSDDEAIEDVDEILNILPDIVLGDGTLLGDDDIYMNKINSAMTQAENQRLANWERQRTIEDKLRADEIDAAIDSYVLQVASGRPLNTAQMFREFGQKFPDGIGKLSGALGAMKGMLGGGGGSGRGSGLTPTQAIKAQSDVAYNMYLADKKAFLDAQAKLPPEQQQRWNVSDAILSGKYPGLSSADLETEQERSIVDTSDDMAVKNKQWEDNAYKAVKQVWLAYDETVDFNELSAAQASELANYESLVMSLAGADVFNKPSREQLTSLVGAAKQIFTIQPPDASTSLTESAIVGGSTKPVDVLKNVTVVEEQKRKKRMEAAGLNPDDPVIQERLNVPLKQVRPRS
jgi:hypothetical protein